MARPDSDTLFRAASEVITERGYLVIGCPPHVDALRKGNVLYQFAGYPSPAPLKVVAVTDLSDWLSQVKLFAKFLRLKMDERRDLRGSRFYRVTAD